LGDLRLKQQQWDLAAAAYQQAVQAQPDSSWTYNNLGSALFNLGKWDECVVAFERASQLNPDFVWAHYNLAEALIKQGNYQKAIDAYSRVLTVDASQNFVRERLGDALRQQAKANLEAAAACYCQANQEPRRLRRGMEADLLPNPRFGLQAQEFRRRAAGNISLT
jgi:O-antigen biosynthesis protein